MITSSNWEDKIIDLGEVKPNHIYKAVFSNKPDHKYVSKIEPDCGCLKIKYDEEEHKLSVRFKPDHIPFHINESKWRTTKGITVTYYDGSTERLVVTALITKS